MSDELYVWIYPPLSLTPVACGKLSLIRGRKCLFEYAPAWLESARPFALSPDLPLRAGAFEPPSGHDIHPVFQDAGPDRWGQRIIEQVFNPRRRSEIDYLALAGEDRIGALAFTWHAEGYEPEREQVLHRADLAALIAAANALERRDEISSEMRRLLKPGTSAGGARPKAIIEHEGRRWIAKFPVDGDMVDMCAVEHASLRLAQQCGIRVPDSRLVPVGQSNALLVERFDRHEDGSRIHYSSARTMFVADGVESAAYSDLSSIARRYAPSPAETAREIFRRMAYNVLLENTDDHEKNHAFLWIDGKWNLAPAYDIQPQLNGLGYQELVVGKDGNESSLQNVMSDCGRFMLTNEEARDEIDAMLRQLKDWPEAFASNGVSGRDIDVCKNYVLVEREAEKWRDAPVPKKASRPRMKR